MSDVTRQEFPRWVAGFEAKATPPMLAERALAMLEANRVWAGCSVDMMEHGLQTATRALRDGADEELVVMALLHDVGELLTPINHGEVAAALLRPYISPQNHWILQSHEVFQAYFWQDAVGLPEKDTRERFKASPYYDACIFFCERYDQVSFDPDYE